MSNCFYKVRVRRILYLWPIGTSARIWHETIWNH